MCLYYLSEVKKIVNILNKQEYEVDEDLNQRNWQMVSRVFDRCCVIIFSILCLILVIYYIGDLAVQLHNRNDDDF